LATGQDGLTQPAAPPPRLPIDVFLSFAEADKSARNELEKRLGALVKAGALLTVWHREMIEPGQHRGQTVQQRIDASQVILLLLSADYLVDAHAEIEAERALRRRADGMTTIVPVHLSEVVLPSSLAELQGVPRIGTVKGAKDRQAAWNEVTSAIRKIVERKSSSYPPPESMGLRVSGPPPSLPAPAVLNHEQLRLPPLPSLSAPPAAAPSSSDPEPALEQPPGSAPDTKVSSVVKPGASKTRRRAAEMLKAGALLGDGRFRVISLLRKDPFTSVWRADDRSERRDVAIRVLHPEVAADKQSLIRFNWAARSMHQISHPNLVELLDKARSDSGQRYYVMELITGGTLHHAALARRFSTTQMLSILFDVGNALWKVHARRWLHRAVNPTNILLTRDETPKLTDFDIFGGCALEGASAAGRMAPVAFAAPEMITRPQSVDTRSDVYGLGMTALFALRGREWADDERPRDLIIALASSEPVKRVLLRATEVDPGLRYGHAGELCAALRTAIGETSVDGIEPPPETLRTPADLDRRRPSIPSIRTTFEDATPAPPVADPEDTAQLPQGFVDRAVAEYRLGNPAAPQAPPRVASTQETLKVLPTMTFGETPLLSITDAYFLVVKWSGAQPDEKLSLVRSPTRFGRADDPDMVVLPSPRISRSHASVEMRGLSLVVVDQGSTNHTFIIRAAEFAEREQVIGVALLNEGDQLTFGAEYRLMLCYRERVRGEAYARELKRHTIDAATGLASDPFLRWQLEQATLTARRRKEHLSFALLRVARREGAPEISDDALVSDLVSELDRVGIQGRAGAKIGRIGATQLGIILPGVRAAEATLLAQAVRAGAPRHMTIRHGVADLLAGDKDGTEALLQRALQALQSLPQSSRLPR
jgi:serine/threonine protein kinase/GGDEF domain-containing protein